MKNFEIKKLFWVFLYLELTKFALISVTKNLFDLAKSAIILNCSTKKRIKKIKSVQRLIDAPAGCPTLNSLLLLSQSPPPDLTQTIVQAGTSISLINLIDVNKWRFDESTECVKVKNVRQFLNG